MSEDRFKFRIWKPKAKEFCYSDEFAIDATGMIWNLLDEEPYAEADTNIVDMCTGLRDAAGTIVYEGDIIERFGVDGEPMRYVVEWNKDFARFDGVFIPKWTNYRVSISEEWLSAFNERVIGNYHENHELLEAKK